MRTHMETTGNTDSGPYYALLDFEKVPYDPVKAEQPRRMTEMEAVRLALIELRPSGEFDTIRLAKKAREIAGRFITDGSVTRLARMCRAEFPFICVNRKTSKYQFLKPAGIAPNPAPNFEVLPELGGNDGM